MFVKAMDLYVYIRLPPNLKTNTKFKIRFSLLYFRLSKKNVVFTAYLDYGEGVYKNQRKSQPAYKIEISTEEVIFKMFSEQ